MNQPTGRCPACGIGRFLPSGLCDHCGAPKPETKPTASGVTCGLCQTPMQSAAEVFAGDGYGLIGKSFCKCWS